MTVDWWCTNCPWFKQGRCTNINEMDNAFCVCDEIEKDISANDNEREENENVELSV